MACNPPYCHGTGDWCGCNCRCCPPPCCDLIRLTFYCGSHATGCGLIDEESFDCCEEGGGGGIIIGGRMDLGEFPTFDHDAFLFSLKDNELAAQLFGGPASVPCSIPCQPIYVNLYTDGCCLEILDGVIYAVGAGTVTAEVTAEPNCEFCGFNGPTIDTDCCGEVPEIFSAKINTTGSCCLDPSTYFDFVYDGGLDLWTAEIDFCSTTLYMELYCDSEDGWTLDSYFTDDCIEPFTVQADGSCDPFILTFEYILEDSCECEFESFIITVQARCTTSSWIFEVDGFTDNDCDACELLNCSRWYLTYDPVYECLWKSNAFSFCECPDGDTPPFSEEEAVINAQWVLERFSETEFYLGLGNPEEDCYFYIWFGEVDPNKGCCSPITLTLVDGDNTSCVNIPEEIEIYPIGCDTLIPSVNSSPGSTWVEDCETVSVTLSDEMCCACCLIDMECVTPHDENVFFAKTPFLNIRRPDERRGRTVVNVKALREKIAKRARFARRLR